MPQPPNRPLRRGLVVLTVVVSTVALGLFAELVSDPLSQILSAHPAWLLPVLAALFAVGVVSVSASTRRGEDAQRPEPSKPGEASDHAERPVRHASSVRPGRRKHNIKVGRRALLSGLAAAGIVAAGVRWRQGFLNLVQHGAWAPSWVSTDRDRFEGTWVAFDPDGDAIAYMRADGTSIGVREPGTDIEYQFTWLDESQGEHLAFSNDGQLLANTHGYAPYDDSETSVRIWSLESRELVQEIITGIGESTLISQFNPVRPELIVSNAGWTEEYDTQYSLTVWSLDSAERIASVDMPDNPFRIALSPDGTVAAVATWDKRVRLLDSGTLEEFGTLVPVDYIDALAFSPDGSQLVGAGPNGREGQEAALEVAVWDVASQTQIATLSRPGRLTASSIAFRPDGREVAIGTGVSGSEENGETDIEILTWDLQSGEPSVALPIEDRAVIDLRYVDAGEGIVGLLRIEDGVIAWERWERP